MRGKVKIESIDKKSRGTSVILSLKKDAEEFLDEYRLK